MPLLKNTKIYRGGMTARGLNLETEWCLSSVDQRDEALDIQFHMASAGSGTTQVLLKIGKSDFEAILRELATTLPDIVGVLSECASIANKRNLELLENARKVQTDEKARVKSLIDDLEPVEEFVTQKYYAAPAGEDEKEAQIKSRLQQVMNSLRRLH